jgi:DHA2 family multidrug resistance protein
MTGLAITAFTLYLMAHFTNDTSAWTIFMIGTLQGFAFGMVFVSVNTVAFLTLPDHLRTYGASFQTLVRNIGSSFGISFVISELTETSRRTRAELGDFVNPFNDALKMPDVASVMDLSTATGRALADQMLNMQALIIAYSHDFWLLMAFAICALPVAFIIGPTKATFIKSIQRPSTKSAPPPEPAE